MATGRRRLLTISEAAELLGVHPNTLRGWADRGLVPVVRMPSGYRRFDPDDIEREIAKMRSGDAGKLAA